MVTASETAQVRVGTVRVRGPAPDRRAAVDAVEHARWPQSAPGEWIFIRRMQVRGPRHAMRAAIGREAHRLLNCAVPGSAAGAANAEVVRFGSLAELLAALSLDLVQGRARERWYWRRWSHLWSLSPGEALVGLWREQVFMLASVTAALAIRGQLRQVWEALGAGEVEALLALLSTETGIKLPALGWGHPAMGPRPQVVIPAALRSQWQPVIGELTPAHPRVWLAACVVGLQWRALTLRANPGDWITALAHALVVGARTGVEQTVVGERPIRDAAGDLADQESRGETETLRPRARREEIRVANAPSTDRVHARAPQITPLLSEEASAPDDDVPTSGVRSLSPQPLDAESVQSKEAHLDAAPAWRDFPVAESGGAWNGEARSECHYETSASQADDSKYASSAPEMDELQSSQGGLFYLVNFLLRPEVSKLLAAVGGREALVDGWVWVYRLGLELGLEPHGDLAHWLAECMGFDDPVQLDSLPPLPGRAALLSLAHRLYDPYELWRPALLNVPARILRTASHIDVYYPIDTARLTVRLAGLDVNPGWVPWLGRVLTFFYDDGSPA